MLNANSIIFIRRWHKRDFMYPHFFRDRRNHRVMHRVFVMREGKITGELTDQHINEEEILLYATGLKGKGYVQ